MAINFPVKQNIPADIGFEYTDIDTQLKWVWDGKSWNAIAAGGASVVASASAPDEPEAGDMWWDTNSGKLKIYYEDENSSQWVDAFNINGALSVDLTGYATTSALNAYASLTSPNFTGVPTAPTAAAGTSTTQIATTQFVTQSISVGTGASAVIYDEKAAPNEGGFFGNASTYSWFARGAGGFDTNNFVFIVAEQNGSTSNRLRLKPFTVNRSTGVITFATQNNIWNNTSSSSNGASTIWMATSEGTGKFCFGTNSPLPGYSSHVFGIAWGRLDTNNVMQVGSYEFTNGDHGYNGRYTAIPSDTSQTGFRTITAGYDANNSSRAMYRVWNWTGNNVSYGGKNSLSSDTSTTYGVSIMTQPNLAANTTLPQAIIQYRVSPSDYRFGTINSNGSYTNVTNPLGNWSSNAIAFHLQNGKVIQFQNNGSLVWTSYSSTPTVITAKAPFQFSDFKSEQCSWIANDTWIAQIGSGNPYSPVPKLVKFSVSDTGITVLGYADVSTEAAGYWNTYSGFKLLKNLSGVYDKIVWFEHSTGAQSVKVTSLPEFK
jgi:hypothetical protein